MTVLQPEASGADSQYDEIETPDDIREFFTSIGSRDKFHCLIRQVRPGGGGYYTLSTIKNQVPTVEQIGKEYGPGDYLIQFTWYPPKNSPDYKNGGTLTKQTDISLPENPWKRLHLIYMDELRDKDLADARDRMQDRLRSAQVAAVESGHVPGAAPDSFTQITKMTELLKSLGIPVGGSTSPRIDWTQLIAALTPLAVAFLTRPNNQLSIQDLLTMQQNQMNSMLALTQNRTPVEQHMAGFLNTVMETTGKLARIAGNGGAPAPDDEEKETWVDKIFGLIEMVGPSVIEKLAAKAPPERKQDRLYKTIENSEDVKMLQSDPELLEKLVTRLDQEYGFEETNKVLRIFEEFDLKRPASTLQNAERYPSRSGEDKGGS